MGFPTGPQIPFSKDRTYGQQPGFISRHSGKIFIVLAVIVIIGTIWAIAQWQYRESINSEDKVDRTSMILKSEVPLSHRLARL